MRLSGNEQILSQIQLTRVRSFVSPMNTLTLDLHSGVATITLNRPDKLNAINSELLSELESLLRDLEADTNVRAVIVTGSGKKAFAAGADIAELHQQTAHTGKKFAEQGQHVFNMIEQLSKPVIAAVNGFALGGGCELAMACHLRFAGAHAKLGLPEISLGILPGYGGTQRMPRLIGTAKALEYILSCSMIDANTALQIGLVNRVIEQELLLSETQSFAEMVAKRPVHSVKAVLRTVLGARETTVPQGLHLEADAFGTLCGTEDFKEGTGAFLEKREAIFTGR